MSNELEEKVNRSREVAAMESIAESLKALVLETRHVKTELQRISTHIQHLTVATRR